MAALGTLTAWRDAYTRAVLGDPVGASSVGGGAAVAVLY